MYKIGEYAEFGKGCKKNYKLSLEMYLRAANAGSSIAMFRLGISELNGLMGKAHDVSKAVKWFKRASAGI